jgi:type IV secretion system protein TrbE
MTLFLITFGVLVGIGAAYVVMQFREYRSEPQGLSDVLGWAFLVHNGVIIQKDGSFVFGWRYRGPDFASATADEMNLLSEHVNAALLPFTDQWMFHFDAVRMKSDDYASEGAFPDPISRLLDDERRKAYESEGSKFVTENYLVATFLPNPQMYDRLGQMFMQGQQEETGWDAIFSGFLEDVENLESRLNARIEMERLGSDELITHLHRSLTGLDHKVLAPRHGSYLNTYLSSQEFTGGSKPVVGGKHIRVVGFAAYPRESYVSMLDKLMEQPFEFRWSNRWVGLSPAVASKIIDRQQRGWWQKRKGAGSWVSDMTSKSEKPKNQEDEMMFEDANARAMVKGAADAVAQNSSGLVRFGFYNSLMIVMEDSAERAELHAKKLAKVINDSGFTSRIETVNTFDAFLGSLPGDGHHNLRRPLLSSLNVVDLLPITSVWPGLEHNPSPFFPAESPALIWTTSSAGSEGAGSTPFRVNLHDSDVGHSLIIGGTGAGKSTLMGFLCAQFLRYPNAQCFIFDKGMSAKLMCDAVGGQHYDIQPGDARLQFQPLAKLDRPGERAWALDWVETLFTLQKIDITPTRRNSIERALEMVADMPRGDRTITSLMMQLQDTDLRAALAPYTGEGVYGYLLDAHQDGLTDGSFQVFEMHRLMDLGDKITIPVLLYLFHRLEERLDAGRPTIIVIEEAWQPLTSDSFADKIKEWLLTLRKRNAAVVLVTQSLAQLYELKIDRLSWIVVQRGFCCRIRVRCRRRMPRCIAI